MKIKCDLQNNNNLVKVNKEIDLYYPVNLFLKFQPLKFFEICQKIKNCKKMKERNFKFNLNLIKDGKILV